MAEISIKKGNKISIRLSINDTTYLMRKKDEIRKSNRDINDKEKKFFIKKIWVNDFQKLRKLKKMGIPWLFKLDFYDFIQEMQPGSKESRSYYIKLSVENFKKYMIKTRATAVKKKAPSNMPNVLKQGTDIFRTYQQELIDLRKENYKNNYPKSNIFYPYGSIRGSDGKELTINGAISFDTRTSWEKALCVGGPNAQVCSVNGYPIGWRVKSKQPEVSKITTLIKNQLTRDDRKTVKNYRARAWRPDNFETWERCNCWLCGLPLTDDEKAPSGEHKVQLAWMACFGAGPLTKLFNAHFLNEEGDVEQKLMEGSVLSSQGWSSVRGKIIPDEKFRAWKKTIRGESYAWSHQWCNYVKGGYSFVKIGYDDNDNLVYYINHSAIKWFAEQVHWCRPKKKNGKWVLGNLPSPQSHGSHISYRNGPINRLALHMNEKEDKFKHWGGEFIYKNIVKQLVGLVKLLNEGFPDITSGMNLTRQEKIKQNLHINYKRLEKLFSAISSDTYTYYGKNKDNELKQFFDKIMNKEKKETTVLKSLLTNIFGDSNYQDIFIKDTVQMGAGRNVKVNNDGKTAIVDVDTDTNNKFFELFVECFNMGAGLEEGKTDDKKFEERQKLLKDIFADNVSDNLLLPPEVVNQLDDNDDNSKEYNSVLMLRDNPIIPEDDVDVDVELMNDVLEGKIQGPLVDAVKDLMNEEFLLDQKLEVTDKKVSEIECSNHIQAWLSEYKNQICEELIKKENEYREKRKFKIGIQGDKLSNMNIMSPYNKDSLESNPEDCFKVLKDNGIIDSTEFKHYSDLFSNEPISPVKNQPRYEDGTDAPIHPAWKVNLAYWLKIREPVIDANGEYIPYWNELKGKWSVKRKYINGSDIDRNNLEICVRGGYMPKVTTSAADDEKIIAWLRDYDQKKRQENWQAIRDGKKPNSKKIPKPKLFKTPSLTVGLAIERGFPEGFPGDTRKWKDGSNIVKKWKNIRLEMLKENPDIKKPVESLYKMKTTPIEKIMSLEEEEQEKLKVAKILTGDGEGLNKIKELEDVEMANNVELLANAKTFGDKFHSPYRAFGQRSTNNKDRRSRNINAPLKKRKINPTTTTTNNNDDDDDVEMDDDVTKIGGKRKTIKRRKRRKFTKKKKKKRHHRKRSIKKKGGKKKSKKNNFYFKDYF